MPRSAICAADPLRRAHGKAGGGGGDLFDAGDVTLHQGLRGNGRDGDRHRLCASPLARGHDDFGQAAFMFGGRRCIGGRARWCFGGEGGGERGKRQRASCGRTIRRWAGGEAWYSLWRALWRLLCGW
jgi:hypothetical protein